MFLKVFLLSAILGKISPAAISEHDLYDNYDVKDYADYEYDDAISDEAITKKIDATIYIPEVTSKKDTKTIVRDGPTTLQNLILNKKHNNNLNIPTKTSENDIFAASTDYYDDKISDQVISKSIDTTKYVPEVTSEKDIITKEIEASALQNLVNIKGYGNNLRIPTRKYENATFAASTDYYDDETFILSDRADVNNSDAVSKLPSAGYEVVENVDDIPNNVTFKPILTNFTIKLPLNNATGNENDNNNKNNDKDAFLNFLYGHGNKKDKNQDVNNIKDNLKKTTINIFHVNAEFDDDKNNKPVVQNIHINKVPFGIFKIKDNVDKFRDDVLNHVYSTEVYDDISPGFVFPNLIAGTKNFFNKIREKSSALFHRIF